MSDEKTPPSGKDFVALGPDLGDGTRPFFRHRSDHTIETGYSRAVEDGKPINTSEHGSLVRLTPVGGPIYEVETLYENRPQEGDAKGPAKVSSDAYRRGWETIFGTKKPVGDA